MNAPEHGPLAPLSSLLHSMSVGGVFARSEIFEQVIDGLSALISRSRDPKTEVLRFPPVMSRHQIERSGYLHSFPHLLGAVCCLHGTEHHIRAAIDSSRPQGEWTTALAATDLVLVPAACYPLYPLIAARGQEPENELLFDVACDCFRYETSYETGRLVSFRMRELVCMGTPDQILEFRGQWISRSKKLAHLLELPNEIKEASDPFFGRAGKLMAFSQVEQSLKFEMLIPVRSETEPTACMSFNYHRDHFGAIWGLRSKSGDLMHTGCVAFGLDRLALALFARHGLDLERWPRSVLQALMPAR
jgi:seryl-tRNA synthetase